MKKIGILCRQCGFGIVRVALWNRNYRAQQHGFCCAGCEQVYEVIKRKTLEAA